MEYQPLADEIRPNDLSAVVGQSHILGEEGLLRRMIEGGGVSNLIFYGPSGTGKTTVANIIAKQTRRPLYRLNATSASIADIKDILAQVGTLLAPEGVLLYLDEIQYFNKKQQQSLLEFMENGKVTLIASTTENPFFYVFGAVLSRASVFEFRPVEPKEIERAVVRGFDLMSKKLQVEIQREDGVELQIATACGGDVRRAMNAVELLVNASPRTSQNTMTITMDDTLKTGGGSGVRYDRDGESHYDVLSGLQKSIRGSDPDGALHYLARLVAGGDLLSACRRLMVIACEDVGLAYPQIIPIVKSCVDAAQMLGFPEARIPLADATVLMATSPKSNSAYLALNRALIDVQSGKSGQIPRHLQNVHADSTGQERAQGYLYPHDYPNHWVAQQYLPDQLQGCVYYEYGDNKLEQMTKQYWHGIKE